MNKFLKKSITVALGAGIVLGGASGIIASEAQAATTTTTASTSTTQSDAEWKAAMYKKFQKHANNYVKSGDRATAKIDGVKGASYDAVLKASNTNNMNKSITFRIHSALGLINYNITTNMKKTAKPVFPDSYVLPPAVSFPVSDETNSKGERAIFSYLPHSSSTYKVNYVGLLKPRVGESVFMDGKKVGKVTKVNAVNFEWETLNVVDVNFNIEK